MLRLRAILMPTIVLCFSGLFFFPPNAHGASQKHVLVLNSYHQGYAWLDGIMKGIKSVLQNNGHNIDLNFEYMDTKHYTDKSYLEQLYKIYKLKFQNRKFDVVIACDESAFYFTLEHHDEIFPKIPVVFCGVNGFKDSLLKGHKDFFTGVVEELDIKKTLDIALKLHPGTRKVYVIHDRTTTGMTIAKQVHKVIQRNNYPVAFVFLVDMDMPELQKKAQNLPGNCLIL